MSFINSSRGGSLGFLPARSTGFKDRGTALWQRDFIGMVDVRKRVTWPEGGVGEFEFHIDTVGDLNGADMWSVSQNPKEGAPRPIPMWRFSTPCVTIAPEEDDGDPPNCTVPGNQMFYLPWHHKDANNPFPFPDHSVAERQYAPISCNPKREIEAWSHVPAGVIGISLALGDEDELSNVFLPTDQRLIAGSGGSKFASTKVCDCEGWEISTLCNGVPEGTDRTAPLNTLTRVIPHPLQQIGPCAIQGPFLSLQLVKDACAAQLSAGCMSFQRNMGRDFTAGMMSHQDFGGPFDPGHRANDKHKIWQDPDGNKGNALHFSIDALWFLDEIHDAPMKFDSDYVPSELGDNPIQVTLDYDRDSKHIFCGDEKDGIWRWSAWLNEDYSEPPSSDDPRRGPERWPFPPFSWFFDRAGGAPGGSGGAFTPSWLYGDGGNPFPAQPPMAIQQDGAGTPLFTFFDPEDLVRKTERGHERAGTERLGRTRTVEAKIVSDKDATQRGILISHMEKSFPCVLARPQFVHKDAVDFRNWKSGKHKALMQDSKYSTPVTARLEAIGLQVGTDAPGWTYTKEPGEFRGRYNVPSAAGGFVLLSPDVGLEDHAFGSYSSADDNAEASLIIAPDSSFLKFGTPDPTNPALISSGFGLDYSSSFLRFRRWDGSAWSDTMSMDSTGVTFDKALILADAGALTIASGVVTVTGSYHSIKN
jgi:hypothetical protein